MTSGQRAIPIILLSVWIISTLCPLNAQSANEVWRITSLDWQPYSGSRMTNEGNLVQRLRLLLKQRNIDLVVEFYPWKRAQSIAKGNDYLGYFPAWPEEVYQGFVASNPIGYSDIGLVKLQKSPIQFTSMKHAFAHNKVGIIRTYTYPKSIEELVRMHASNVTTTTSELMLFKMLISERFELAITDPLVLQYMAEKEGTFALETIHQIAKHPLVIAVNDIAANQSKLALINQMTAIK